MAIAYVIAAYLGFRLAFVAEQVTTVWAPTGIGIAALLLWGQVLWPAIWLGAFVANAGSDAPLWTAAAVATGNTLEAVAAAWALRQLPGFDPRLRRIRDVLAFILVGAAMSTTLSATIGVATLCAAAVQPWSSLRRPVVGLVARRRPRSARRRARDPDGGSTHVVVTPGVG